MNSDSLTECQSCGTQLKSRLRNHYKIIEPLGQGGFGKTYLAEDTDKLNELCVVKQLAFNGTQTTAVKKARELFFLEAKQLQSLGEHPQIPSLRAYFEEDNYLYLVQQYIKGQNLADRLKLEGVYNESEIRHFLNDILPVFKFIHQRGVIHRDVKPSNIMYRHKDSKYIAIDFGVSKIINQSSGNTPGTSIGSQGYASIEQYKGNAVPASDLYSLGVCCFCLMSGISPYHLWLDRGYSWVENWQKSIKISLSPELVAILDKLLQKNLKQRYQTAAAVLKDLQQPSQSQYSLAIELDSQAELFSDIYDPQEENAIVNKILDNKIKTEEIFSDIYDSQPEITASKKYRDPVSSSRTKTANPPQNVPQKINKLQASLIASLGITLFLAFQFVRNPNTSPLNAPVAKQEDLENSQKNLPKFTEIEQVPSGLFNYGGSTTWASIRAKMYPPIKNAWPDYQLRYLDPVNGNPGSSVGIKMLLEDQLSFSLSSRPLKNKEFQQARIRGYTIEQVPVAIDAIAVATHPSLSISGITIAQLADIYSGKITNWKEIGGPDLAIAPYSRHLNEGGTVEFFAKNVLGDRQFANTVVEVPNTTTGIRKVAENPGAIYYASASQIVSQCTVKALAIGRQSNFLVSPYRLPYLPPSQCNSLHHNQLNKQAFVNGDYPITRRLFVIIRKDGRKDELAGLTYVKMLSSDLGQKMIGEAGFIGMGFSK